jgi:hypothetical protein
VRDVPSGRRSACGLAGFQMVLLRIVVHRPGAYNGNVLGNLVRRVTKVIGAPMSGCGWSSPKFRAVLALRGATGRNFRRRFPSPAIPPCLWGRVGGALSANNVARKCSILLRFLLGRPLSSTAEHPTRGSGPQTAATQRNSGIAMNAVRLGLGSFHHPHFVTQRKQGCDPDHGAEPEDSP